MIFESRSDPRISRNPRDHLDTKIDQPRAHKLLPEGPGAVRIRVETCGRHKKFDSPHGTSTRARFRQFSIRGFREFSELAVWQNCTSPTRPIGFPCTAMVLGSGLGIPIDGENTGGCGGCIQKYVMFKD